MCKRWLGGSQRSLLWRTCIVWGSCVFKRRVFLPALRLLSCPALPPLVGLYFWAHKELLLMANLSLVQLFWQGTLSTSTSFQRTCSRLGEVWLCGCTCSSAFGIEHIPSGSFSVGSGAALAGLGEDFLICRNYNLEAGVAPLSEAKATGRWRSCDEDVVGDNALPGTHRVDGVLTGRTIDFAISTPSIRAHEGAMQGCCGLPCSGGHHSRAGNVGCSWARTRSGKQHWLSGGLHV